MPEAGSELGLFEALGVVTVTGKDFVGALAAERHGHVLTRQTRKQHGGQRRLITKGFIVDVDPLIKGFNDVVGLHHERVMIRADMMRHACGVFVFTMAGVANKAKVKYFGLALTHVFHERGDERGINTPADKGTERYVGHEHGRHRALEFGFELIGQLRFAGGPLGFVVRVPVGPLTGLTILHPQCACRLQLADLLEDGEGCGNVLAFQVELQGIEINVAADAGMREDGLKLGGKQDALIILINIQWFDTQWVSGQEQRFGLLIPEGKGKHTFQAREGIIAPGDE